MVRTRDFLILLLILSFLAVGGGVTALYNKISYIPVNDQLASLIESNSIPNNDDFRGEVVLLDDDRAHRLAEMREAVAKEDVAIIPNIEENDISIPETEITETELVSDESEDGKKKNLVNYCSGYQNLNIIWNPKQIIQTERDGMRFYVEMGEIDDLTGAPTEITRVRVPLRQWPLSSFSCLPTDVIGVALDGSLIRNNEQKTYAVFGADTLIGYALDGFPIYGSTGISADDCGGVMVNNSYRYVIDSNRDGVINCFAGIPTLPL